MTQGKLGLTTRSSIDFLLVIRSRRVFEKIYSIIAFTHKLGKKQAVENIGWVAMQAREPEVKQMPFKEQLILPRPSAQQYAFKSRNLC